MSIAPLGLVDADRVAERRELVAVLGRVDHRGRRAGDVDRARLHLHRERVRDLAADGDDRVVAALLLVDVEDALERELLEVEAVALVVVGRDGLRVVVDHHGLLAHLAQRADRRDGAPVELDRRADAVDARAEDDRPRLVEFDVVLVAVVRHVEVELVAAGNSAAIVSICLTNGVMRIDLRMRARHLGRRRRAWRSACRRSPTSWPAAASSRAASSGEYSSRIFGRCCEMRCSLYRNHGSMLGQRVDLVDRPAAAHRERDRVDALVGRRRRGLDSSSSSVRASPTLAVEAARLEAADGRVGHAQRLLQRLLEGAADGHHLADRLHRRADLARDAVELGEVPPRHLDHEVVERRLEARGRRARDRVA